ncbi:divalent-cation tolerance protein CutA [Streptacidiphilus fuscans]|uniref:Divalent-cation tolerance protein CutA n=1 Tax=Streptacidiphilus fuscans TaxID=2789292 RepID=A0A931B7Z4_9ACTN|nr:divalent-cation tolerance protein CutA [Streptacidiphilus fuscans]MBF9071878.1 divalent-cation tolerance protein CutA [Streptacidiphilus fuscans]
MADYVLVLTTVPSADAAAKLSRSAVEAGFAASGQVSGPIETTYRHLGEVCEGTEWQIAFRAPQDRYPELEAHLIEQHPYDSPEVIALPIVAAPSAYLEWITRATR